MNNCFQIKYLYFGVGIIMETLFLKGIPNKIKIYLLEFMYDPFV